MLLLKVSLFVTFFFVAKAFITSLKRSRAPVKALRSSNPDDGEFPENTVIDIPESSLWNERVEYVDLNAKFEENPNSRSLPLFLLGGPFFPQGITYLNVFEMRYRTMMFDVSNADDVFGYVHTCPQTGAIASIGTMCKITDRQLLDDGRQFISVKGMGRFRTTKILKTLPYILAEVDPVIYDLDIDDELAMELEQSVYNSLKYYMRLMKVYNSNKDMVVSPAMKKSRHTAAVGESGLTERERRTNFSFAMCNMIQMTQEKESQLMLQTLSVIKRLKVQKEILTQAVIGVENQLLQLNLITPDLRDQMKVKSFSDFDSDDDILPSDYEGEAKEEEKDEWDISNME